MNDPPTGSWVALRQEGKVYRMQAASWSRPVRGASVSQSLALIDNLTPLTGRDYDAACILYTFGVAGNVFIECPNFSPPTAFVDFFSKQSVPAAGSLLNVIRG